MDSISCLLHLYSCNNPLCIPPLIIYLFYYLAWSSFLFSNILNICYRINFSRKYKHLYFVCFQVKKNYEALRQREEEERMVQSLPPKGEEDPQAVTKWEKESHEATRELLKVKDRLIEVERNVSCDVSNLQVPVSLKVFCCLRFLYTLCVL